MLFHKLKLALIFGTLPSSAALLSSEQLALANYDLLPILTYSLVSLLFVAVLFDRLLWRLPGINRLFAASRPFIGGTWEADFHAEKSGSYKSSQRSGKPAYLCISQTFSSLKMQLYSGEATSESLVCNLRKTSTKHFELMSLYASRLGRENSSGPTPYGALVLELSARLPTEISGTFWNNRKNSGEIRIHTRVSKKLRSWEKAAAYYQAHFPRNKSGDEQDTEQPRLQLPVPGRLSSAYETLEEQNDRCSNISFDTPYWEDTPASREIVLHDKNSRNAYFWQRAAFYYFQQTQSETQQADGIHRDSSSANQDDFSKRMLKRGGLLAVVISGAIWAGAYWQQLGARTLDPVRSFARASLIGDHSSEQLSLGILDYGKNGPLRIYITNDSSTPVRFKSAVLCDERQTLVVDTLARSGGSDTAVDGSRIMPLQKAAASDQRIADQSQQRWRALCGSNMRLLKLTDGNTLVPSYTTSILSLESPTEITLFGAESTEAELGNSVCALNITTDHEITSHFVGCRRGVEQL